MRWLNNGERGLMGRYKLLDDVRKITFNCSGETYEHVERMALLTGQNISTVIRATLNKHLDNAVYILGRKDD